MKLIEDHKSFEGRQQVWEHLSAETNTPMRFSVYLPPAAEQGPVPVLWWLSGLTCTEQNFMVKAGHQRFAAELGLMVVGPDTSPRGDDVPDDPEKTYSLGKSAGYYLDATEEPWARNYRMRSYVEQELPALVASHFPADMARQGISGHSMGGHGALTVALRNPDRFRSVSCTAPISSPMRTEWGRRALTAYLGPDKSTWREHDATALIEDGARLPEILVDQGEADEFMDRLRPDLLEDACAVAGQPLTLRRRPGYDHSFFFVASVIEDHARWHAERLRR
ncbi:MAG TPA: S-formylglutathione hydrolase [Caulobacteraceae bacterium]|jgi:S-formylglutathione hydrolase